MAKSRWTADDIKAQDGRVAIVTGANNGLGFEDARVLVDKGATVVMACRNRELGEKAARTIMDPEPKGRCEVIHLDLSNLSSVHDFAKEFRARFDRLDLLINNAGVMMPPLSRTADRFELQLGTNHLGHFALTGLLLDLLLQTPESRVVNVSSNAHRYGSIDFEDPNWERRPYKELASYGQSKLANLLFTLELQRRLAKAETEVLALSSHPGWTRTNLQQHSTLFRMINPILGMEPRQGALPTLHAATADDVAGGEYYGPDGWQGWRGWPRRVDMSDAAKDPKSARKLWELSEELTGVRFDALPA